MKKVIILSVLTVWNILSFAQITQTYSKPLSLFNEGIALYQQQQYSASYRTLSEYTNLTQENAFFVVIFTINIINIDKKEGFLAGTDDYMIKPYDEEEMLLRIKALLRRSKAVTDHKLIIGDVILDYDSLTVTKNDEVQTLPQKEFLLLFKLLSSPNKIFTRIQLMDEIWGLDSDSYDNTVNVHINRLRNRYLNYEEFEIVS